MISALAENGEPNGLVIFNTAEREHTEKGGTSKRSDKVINYLETKRKEVGDRRRATMP